MFLIILAEQVAQEFTTTDRIAAWALGIAILTASGSILAYWHSYRLTKVGFDRNFRPYLSVLNPKTDKENFSSEIAIKVMNAPANIYHKKISFIVRTRNEKDKKTVELQDDRNEILYPMDAYQSSPFISKSFAVSHELAEKMAPSSHFVRKIRIEYGWIADDSIKYFFESESLYSSHKRLWEVVYQKAN